MRNKRIIAVGIILFIVFSVIAFVVPTELTKTFWIAYGFTVASFAIELYMWMSFFQKNPNPMSRFYRIPVLNVCNWYIGLQVVAFLLLKLFPNIPSWIAIVINVLIIAASIIGFITLESAAEYVASVDDKVKPKVTYIKNLQVEIELISSGTADVQLKKKLDELAEKIRFSDPMSDSSLYSLEQQIAENINVMKRSNEETKETLAEETIRLLEERSKKCKLLK